MGFVEIIKVIIIGIIEGITEWLPISSTGHMILFNEFFPLTQVDEDFMNMFNVVIQLGAIMAVVVLYFKRLWPFCMKETEGQKRKPALDKDKWILWFKIIIACIPLGLIGVLFEDKIDSVLMNSVVTAIALIFYGILFIIIEKIGLGSRAKYLETSQITYKTAIFIGLFQLLSLVPGTSRSGATIVGGMLVGTSRVAAAEFTFFLAIPVMFGASLLKMIKFGFDFTMVESVTLILGMLTAFFTSLLAIKFLIGYIKKHNFILFGWYRIVLGIVVLLIYFLI